MITVRQVGTLGHFGNTDIYCPWDVINFAKKLVWDPSARPSAFWINSSGNDMVKRFVDKATRLREMR